jgi:hypothetical protein
MIPGEGGGFLSRSAAQAFAAAGWSGQHYVAPDPWHSARLDRVANQMHAAID